MSRAALAMVFLLLAMGCGDRSVCTDPPCEDLSDCELFCHRNRGELIQNFGIPSDDLDCSDDDWRGGCDRCEVLLRVKFSVQLDQDACPP